MLKTNSLPVLFSDAFLRSATEPQRKAIADTDDEMISMTIRVPRGLRNYYESQAKAIGAASPSAIIAMVLEGVKQQSEMYAEKLNK